MTTLGYALLGLLAREPASGYDLMRQMQAPVGFFWRARHSQIYPELARLEADGFITHEVVAQVDLPDKKVYTITPVGLAQLHAWITASAEPPVIRDEVLLKVFSLWMADPPAAIALLRDQERRHVAQLAVFAELERQLEAKGAEIQRPNEPYFATYLVLRRGIGYEQEYLAWCRWVITMLEQAE
jgi:DNA-binding PadR family transcriptional regulator